MPYDQFTQASFIAQISAFMEDQTNVYFPYDEIARALNEALYHWGSLTSYWRNRGTFNTQPLTPFYDLADQLPLLRTRTYTVDAICREVQYALFEISSGVSGTGLTQQFTAGQIVSAVIAAADQFNLDATMPLSFNLFPGPASPDGRITLTEDIVTVTRVAWQDSLTRIWTLLRREDEFSAQSISPQWNLNPGQPYAYAMATAPPLTLQILPGPLNNGQLHILYSETLNLTPTGPSSTLDIPDEFALAVKWYALYLLLNSYAECFDAYRAKYAFERYQQIIAVSHDLRSLNRVQINGNLVPLDTYWNLDAAMPAWMNMTGTPGYVATSFDILTLVPVSKGGDSVLCDVVQSAPIPLKPTDYIPLGREELSYISDYVRHILSFKIGGSEFGSSFPLYDNFIAGAKQRNGLLSTRVRYLTALFGQAEYNEALLPTA
jgi:hypothetical protein